MSDRQSVEFTAVGLEDMPEFTCGLVESIVTYAEWLDRIAVWASRELGGAGNYGPRERDTVAMLAHFSRQVMTAYGDFEKRADAIEAEYGWPF